MSNKGRMTTLSTPVPNIQLMEDFVTPQEEVYLLTKIEELGGVEVSNEGTNSEGRRYKDKGTAAGWRDVNGRRSMYWGGQLLPNSKTLVPRPFPPFMDKAFPRIIDRVMETGAFSSITEQSQEVTPNHVLVNEYLPGQGIMPHEDGSAYLPSVSTLSLGSHTILDFYEYDGSDDGDSKGRAIKDSPYFSIYLPPRSLIIISGQAYTHLLHGICSRTVDTEESVRSCINSGPNASEASRSRRVSITMRVVTKVRRLM